MMKGIATSFTFKLLTAFFSYLLAVILFTSGIALSVGYREGILTSDQYFNSQSYRRQVEMDMAALIQAASEGTEAWNEVALAPNLRCILVKDNEIVFSNIPVSASRIRSTRPSPGWKPSAPARKSSTLRIIILRR